MRPVLLRIEGLTVTFRTGNGGLSVIDDLDLTLNRNESLAVMGESGCGKSVLGHSIMRLLDDVAEIRGRVLFKGIDVYSMDRQKLRELRGKGISLVPQNPSSAFNPVLRIGHQIKEYVEKCGLANGNSAKEIAIESLARVGFSEPQTIYDSYPHMLSGGMNERALIAMAISVDPEMIIADEPTKGLDYTSKNGILALLKEISRDSTMMMITHDFTAARICSKIMVMYSGQIMEEGPTHKIMNHPAHPYTRGLLDAQPIRGLIPIPGRHKLEDRLEPGCRFRKRCSRGREECRRFVPLYQKKDGRRVRCIDA